MRVFNRKILVAVVAMLALAASFVGMVYAQEVNCGGGNPSSQTTSGTNFLLVYMPNDTHDYHKIDPETYQLVSIATLDQPASITLDCQGVGYHQAVTIPAHSSRTIQLNLQPTQDFLDYDGDSAAYMALVVASDNPIVCYGFNHKHITADAFLALPQSVAQTAYMVMAYKNSDDALLFQNIVYSSEFAVAAFEDNTRVTYIPTVQTTDGVAAGTPKTLFLKAGQCFVVQAQTNSAQDSADLTGTTIVSNNPIAVFGGHQRTEVPYDYYYFDGTARTSSRDHLAEQMPGINTWGHAFVVHPFPPGVLGDLMRVLSSADNDTVFVNGNIWGSPLKAGEYRDTLISYSPTVESQNVVAVQTSQPSLVGMYCHSGGPPPALGDPFLAIVPPLNQTYNDFTYFVSTDQIFSDNRVIIVTDETGVGKITIDGVVVPSSKFTAASVPLTPLGAGSASHRYFVAVDTQLQTGARRIQCPNDPSHGFTILAYGVGNQDSYGYTAGSLFLHTGIWRVPDPVGLPAPGSHPLPSFTIRNVTGAEEVWVDSIRMVYASNPDHIEVKTSNVPMTYLGTLNVADEMRISLAPVASPAHRIVGSARIYQHTGLWTSMEPLDVPFTIEAGAMSSVANETQDEFQVQVYPNPVSATARLFITLPDRSQYNALLFDALGRCVWSRSGAGNIGTNELTIDTHTLTNGTYFYELRADGHGDIRRGALIVSH